MSNFDIKDYTETVGKDLTSKDSVIDSYDFTDTIAFDQTNEGVPGGNLLWYGAQIKKKRFLDDTVEGIWLGVDSDGIAKISIGSTSTGQLVYTGGYLYIAGTFVVGSSGVPTDEHIAVGADYIRLFNTSNKQTLELAPGTTNGGTVNFWDVAGDACGSIYGFDDAGDNTLKIDAVDGLYIDTPAIATTGGMVIDYDTAITSGGAAKILFTTSLIGIYTGSGSPTVSAAKGSLYLRTDGTGTSDRAYINTNGSTTWTAITTAA